MEVLADRVHRYAPPAWRMYEALIGERPQWYRAGPREVEPHVLRAERPSLVVLSSPWPAAPDDVIELHISDHREGSAIRLIWRTPSPPDVRGIAIVRHQLNRRIAGDLRHWVDTGSRVD